MKSANRIHVFRCMYICAEVDSLCYIWSTASWHHNRSPILLWGITYLVSPSFRNAFPTLQNHWTPEGYRWSIIVYSLKCNAVTNLKSKIGQYFPVNVNRIQHAPVLSRVVLLDFIYQTRNSLCPPMNFPPPLVWNCLFHDQSPRPAETAAHWWKFDDCKKQSWKLAVWKFTRWHIVSQRSGHFK